VEPGVESGKVRLTSGRLVVPVAPGLTGRHRAAAVRRKSSGTARPACPEGGKPWRARLELEPPGCAGLIAARRRAGVFLRRRRRAAPGPCFETTRNAREGLTADRGEVGMVGGALIRGTWPATRTTAATKRATPDYAGLRSQVFALCLLAPSRRASARSFGASNSFIWKGLNGAQGRN